ncbi:MAG: tyrosine-type recombinase/integrase [Oscillospiraceae bacterium]|nr:tyrosine-type recombinase/integrase [Oscillospiraceae bacterium]
MNYPEIINRFGSHLGHLGRSKLTSEQYKIDLALLIKFILAKRNGLQTIGEEYDAITIDHVDADFFSALSPDEIYDFLLYAKDERENNTSTRARKLSSIKTFYKFLTGTLRVFSHNPAEKISVPTVKHSLPKHLTLDESMALLEAVTNDAESKTRVRDYAIITLFLNCGMRLAELVGINLSDLPPGLDQLRVIGKGSKERLVYLNSACQAALVEHIKIRGQMRTIHDRDALFLSSRGRRISNKTVQWMVYKYLDAAGLGHKKLSTHKLRHTAATLMYQTGNVDVRVLKEILGHEQLNTTQIYTHVSNAQMQSAMEQNPLSKLGAISEVEEE